MTARATVLAATVLALTFLAQPQIAQTRGWQDFGLGANQENQTCRALWRFESARPPSAVDLYCGAWQSPTGTLRLTASSVSAQAALAQSCRGVPVTIPDAQGMILQQVACDRTNTTGGARRYGLIASANGRSVFGSAYPADWAPMVRAARVALGLERGATLVEAPASNTTPGMREILAVYPEGAPGQGAGFNYELLRRRAYEHNVAWSFSASSRDFEELLRAQNRIAPDDKAGEAEIRAEIALNLSDARRFADAGEMLDRAQMIATEAQDQLLVSKILNYRAIDALNRGLNADALRMARQANALRTQLAPTLTDENVGERITVADATNIERRASNQTARALVVSVVELTPAERSAVLSAQASSVAGTAQHNMGRSAAGADLEQALNYLARSPVQPAWLAGQIHEQRSALALQNGNAGAAQSAARDGLAALHGTLPGTRVEARLLIALERAQRAGGNMTGALASGRAAVDILQHQAELPGMPAAVAAGHLETLYLAWEASRDPALASEYFQTLTLVWDGAASRAAAQLAARLSEGQNGAAIRGYQNADSLYRTALTARTRLPAEASPQAVTRSDQAVIAAAAALRTSEAQVRVSSPRYLELLNPVTSTADLQRALSPTEGYVRLVVAPDAGYGALVTAQGVQPYRVAITDRDLTRTVREIRTSAIIRGRRLPDYDLPGARGLYRALLEPIAAQTASLRTLHIDGGGDLAALPMGALIVSDLTDEQLQRIALQQDYTGVDWLARHFAIDTALGPAAFLRTRQAAMSPGGANVRAFGDFRPDPALSASRIARDHALSDRCRDDVRQRLNGLTRLPNTGDEARQAALALGGTATTGAQFTDNAFLTDQDVASAQVLVIATHGVLGLSSCFEEPALITSVAADGGDGLIEASDLLLRSLRAQLVMLSACDTAGAGGSTVAGFGLADSGEALSGLARAFIYAGSPTVLATQWPVDTRAAALQSNRLLQTAAGGRVSIGEALRLAQATLYDDEETAHPFYWSGLILIGDGTRRLHRDGGA